VYLSASGCALTFVGTRPLTVPPWHPSKYLEPVNGNIELPAASMDRGVRTQQSVRPNQQRLICCYKSTAAEASVQHLKVTLAARQDSSALRCKCHIPFYMAKKGTTEYLGRFHPIIGHKDPWGE
jgi:hypothetical protein